MAANGASHDTSRRINENLILQKIYKVDAQLQLNVAKFCTLRCAEKFMCVEISEQGQVQGAVKFFVVFDQAVESKGSHLGELQEIGVNSGETEKSSLIRVNPRRSGAVVWFSMIG